MPDATHDQDPGARAANAFFGEPGWRTGRTPSQALVRGCLFLGWSAPRRPVFRVKRDTRCATGGVGFFLGREGVAGDGG